MVEGEELEDESTRPWWRTADQDGLGWVAWEQAHLQLQHDVGVRPPSRRGPTCKETAGSQGSGVVSDQCKILPEQHQVPPEYRG